MSENNEQDVKKNNDIVESETDETKTVVESAIQEAEEKVDDFLQSLVSDDTKEDED